MSRARSKSDTCEYRNMEPKKPPFFVPYSDITESELSDEEDLSEEKSPSIPPQIQKPQQKQHKNLVIPSPSLQTAFSCLEGSTKNKSNHLDAVTLFNKALKENKNDALALMGLSYCYRHGVGGVLKNDEVAKRYEKRFFQEASKDDLVKAGMLFAKGFYVKEDIRRAEQCFKLAIEKNSTEAEELLKEMYYNKHIYCHDTLCNIVLKASKPSPDFPNYIKYIQKCVKQQGKRVISRKDKQGRRILDLASHNVCAFINMVLQKVVRHIQELIFYGAIYDDPGTIQFALECGVDINKCDNKSRSPLMAAAYFGSNDALCFLLACGADLDAVDKENRTALIYASSSADEVENFQSYPKIVENLLSVGADPNKQDIYGNTALINASYFGCIRIVKVLLGAKSESGENLVDRELKDVHGRTALHWASINYCVWCVQELVNGGCNDKARDNDGYKPKNYEEIARVKFEKIYRQKMQIDSASEVSGKSEKIIISS